MTKEEAADLLDNLIGMVEDNQDSDYDEALKMAISALSAEGELTNEKAIAFLQDNGWLVEHDRIMTSGLAEGEYIKKEDVLAKREILRDENGTGYQAVRTKYIRELPTYSFPEKEKGEWTRDIYNRVICSYCGEPRRDNRIGHINFCNCCGCDMGGDR